MIEFLASTDFWSVLTKCLLTTLISVSIGAVCTALGKAVTKSKNSKLARHARIAVRAAEMKFPNEGKKMGPEKMAYVMDYLAVTFPKIKSNEYLYNIAEAAVYELNNQNIEEEARQQFKDKYGELPDDLTSGKALSQETTAAGSQTAEKEEKKAEESETSEFSLKSF